MIEFGGIRAVVYNLLSSMPFFIILNVFLIMMYQLGKILYVVRQVSELAATSFRLASELAPNSMEASPCPSRARAQLRPSGCFEWNCCRGILFLRIYKVAVGVLCLVSWVFYCLSLFLSGYKHMQKLTYIFLQFPASIICIIVGICSLASSVLVLTRLRTLQSLMQCPAIPHQNSSSQDSVYDRRAREAQRSATPTMHSENRSMESTPREAELEVTQRSATPRHTPRSWNSHPGPVSRENAHDRRAKEAQESGPHWMCSEIGSAQSTQQDTALKVTQRSATTKQRPRSWNSHAGCVSRDSAHDIRAKEVQQSFTPKVHSENDSVQSTPQDTASKATQRSAPSQQRPQSWNSHPSLVSRESTHDGRAREAQKSVTPRMHSETRFAESTPSDTAQDVAEKSATPQLCPQSRNPEPTLWPEIPLRHPGNCSMERISPAEDFTGSSSSPVEVLLVPVLPYSSYITESEVATEAKLTHPVSSMSGISDMSGSFLHPSMLLGNAETMMMNMRRIFWVMCVITVSNLLRAAMLIYTYIAKKEYDQWPWPEWMITPYYVVTEAVPMTLLLLMYLIPGIHALRLVRSSRRPHFAMPILEEVDSRHSESTCR